MRKQVCTIALAVTLPAATASATDYWLLAGGESDYHGSFIVCSDAATKDEAPRQAYLRFADKDLLILRGSDGLFYFRVSVASEIWRQTGSGVVEAGHPGLRDLYETCHDHDPATAARATVNLKPFHGVTTNGRQPLRDGGWPAIIQRLKAADHL